MIAAIQKTESCFNGVTGDLLKYFLKNEVNNNNLSIIEIAKRMQDKPEAQQILKKIKF